MTTNRHDKGIETLKKTCADVGLEVIDRLNNIYSGLGDLVVEFPYGDIVSRPGLDLKTRQLMTVVALTTLGNAQPQLKIHIQAAIKIGWTEIEIKEAILQMAVYAGFPAMLNAMFTAQEVFDQIKNI